MHALIFSTLESICKKNIPYGYKHKNLNHSREKLIPKTILGLFSIILLFQGVQVFGSEELPIITIDFVSGNIIDLDESPQMIRADIQIQNYNPHDGYHFMQIIRLSDGEIIKTSEIMPKAIGDNLFGVQILHYIDPDIDEENLIGEYGLRVYSEYGSAESVSTFSIIKSSMPITITQNSVIDSEVPEEESDTVETLQIESLDQSESKIPTWVHDIFVWYADETISENELLTALEYLIAEGILDVDY
ncbi:hypothetical protein BD31_I1750 [Candidatus Nitrosopumilus salaria BD31]|uniref:Uncharacterized protein n=1 Tax=Candidatus Nitrosopumilus salarius BD31 TaxID=859350 RepID=I3D081_9ARCH|nr:hypothetical protein [Candidatus Nitrosopumilus salaria]EIJ65124.1 hypothetical protein BD31_I1750 [Candidatus Nitrosopumilus salaria BD31]